VRIIPLRLPTAAQPPVPAADGTPARNLTKEPFGFVDGISQPVIRGAPGARKRSLANDLVAPGEILMGYPDNLGTIPASPSIADKCDPHHFLADRGTDPFRRRPEFSRYEPELGQRDLGANGTFLVVRQIEQHVAAFEAFLASAEEQLKKIMAQVSTDGGEIAIDARTDPVIGPAGTASSAGGMDDHAAIADPGTQPSVTVGASGTPGPLSITGDSGYSKPPGPEAQHRVRELIAAKLVGRWQDGSSLVRNELRPATEDNPKSRPDNAFRLGEEDPRGLACPFGAHIRRANPRDTRFHKTQDESRIEIEAVNRHRILRIGRQYSYHDPEKGPRKGLMFMCLNADIERQFEFIQKTWLLNRNIHGLEGEPDPLMGTGERPFTIPTPSGPIVLTINQTFATVIGGGYFFMPGRAALRYLSGGTLPRAQHAFGGPLVAEIA
jgi:deferrochelatase/peroxidase EfeB